MPVRRPHCTTLCFTVALLLIARATGVCAANPDPPAAARTPAPSAKPTAQQHAGSTAAGPSAAVEQLPTFRLGLWEYRRTVTKPGAAKPQVSTDRKCGDPGAEMRENMESQKKKGCQVAPLRRANQQYVSSWTCQTPTGAMRFREVLRVKDQDGYEDVSETHAGPQVVQQKIEAKRVGECPAKGSDAQPPQSGNPPPHP
jgi:hypothetical protein